MSQTQAEIKRPVKRSEMSKMQWTWKEMKKNKSRKKGARKKTKGTRI